MAPSLRDLMKNEKESRKRNLQLNKQRESVKVQKMSEKEESIPKTSSRDNHTTTNVPSDTKSQSVVHFGPTIIHSSTRNDTFDHTNTSKTENLPDTNDNLTKGLKVVEETYELLEDEPITPPEQLNKKVSRNGEYRNDEYRSDKVRDGEDGSDEYKNDKVIYEQLNTAFCSNLDFERDAILQDFEDTQDVDDYIESEEEDFERTKLLSKSTIVSANFGASNIAVSTSENLPIGFFDDQNIDAKARGKLTTKEATEKIKQLSRKKALYLKEAKYIQEKQIESHREQIRLENDLLDHQEALKDLQSRIEIIKSNISGKSSTTLLDNVSMDDHNGRLEGVQGTSMNDHNVSMESTDHYEEMEELLDFDDIHWRSRAIR